MEKFIERVINGRYTYDGAGVKLMRVFSNITDLTDPFLLLDNFGSNRIEDYINGFPWHPHRGIETVTYVLNGKVEHHDSEGNRGTIYPGDTQWMTAGSGIFHEEMPRYIEENKKVYTEMSGFQLWVNLPGNKKMTTPVYRSLKANDIPLIEIENSKIKLIAGRFGKDYGYYDGGTQDVTYMHVMLNDDEIVFKTVESYRTIIYIFDGYIMIKNNRYEKGDAIILSESGDSITIYGHGQFMFMSGKPLKEPVAWYGPIVMNTMDEINQAIIDLRRNTFVKEKNPIFES
ncbi:pirin family protein [Picrophilus oshimae]|uniref:Pirin n=1 Tax=Picrophilus torridus (strain ATCC 700027 / DSM 9790 / JCM 10055 / NBRC 100828 / KAW 2/3) TaxID=1122961 RepID=Q6KZW8_PICTO|nr:pirin family protein [Picrophilus oshimae]AAT43734.1 pirin [Picrophilus oshimae DSM 9789]